MKRRGNFRRRGGRVGVSGRNNAVLNHVTRVTFRESPLVVAQTTSGTGCLSTTSSSLASLTATTSVTIDPFLIGGRVSKIAGEFAQWRPRFFKITYYPQLGVGGAGDTAGASGTVSYYNRNFCIGFSSDPDIVPANFIGAVELGGQPRTTDRIFSVTAPRKRQWYFCSTTSSSPTTIDLRMVSPYQFYGFFSANSTANAFTYGTLVVDCVLEFRGTSNATVLGRIKFKDLEEKKEDSSKHVTDDENDSPLVVDNGAFSDKPVVPLRETPRVKVQVVGQLGPLRTGK